MVAAVSDRTDERVTTIEEAIESGWSAWSDTAESVKHRESMRLEWQAYRVALASLAADAAETQTLREQVEEWKGRYREEHEKKHRIWQACTNDMFRVLDLRRRTIQRAWRYRAERDEMSKQLDWHIDKVRSLLNIEAERDAAVADRDRLAEAAHDLNEYASNKAVYWQHPLTEKVRAYFDALAGREGSNDA